MSKPKKARVERLLEIEDLGRPKVLDVARFQRWAEGKGSPFQALLAQLLQVVPPPDLTFLCKFLESAWTRETAAVLEGVLDEARRDPGRNGQARAVRSARQMWRDMFVDPPRKRATGPRNPGRDMDVWKCFHVAWARQKSKLSKDAMIRKFVAKDGMRAFAKNGGVRITLTSVRQLEEILARVQRHWPDHVDGWRARIFERVNSPKSTGRISGV